VTEISSQAVPGMNPIKPDQNRLRQKIEEMEELPTLPGIVMRVLSLASDENVTARKMKEVILTDPPLSAKVLKVANSSFFARREKTDSIDQAIVTIGLNELVNICVSTGMIDALDSWEEKHLHRADIWRHSLSTAFLAKSLGLRKDMQKPGSPDLFLCGLLHNIGWIVVDQIMHEELGPLLESAENGEEWTLEKEKQYLGLDHAEIGSIFLKKWGLPDEVCQVVQYHHNPDGASDFAPEAALIGLATTLSPIKFEPDIHVKSVSSHIPHLLVQTSGNAALREMEERYAANINQAQAMADRMMSYI